MNKRLGLALFLSGAALFLIANRAAYRGYFQSDELDSIGWTPQVPLTEFAKELASPLYNIRNFRPVGHLYFRVMSGWFGLDFPKYLGPLHLVHLLNVWLLWLLLRRIGASLFAAGCGGLFFAFQAAVFDVYWKPMYAFDLFCAAFCLLSALCWIERRWILSFACFWMAYKSKELAVMLPAVLACWEFCFGRREWRKLAPFLLVAFSFGLQGLLLNPNHNNSYAFRFAPQSMLAAATFYGVHLFGVTYSSVALVALPAFYRDRRVWMGLAATTLFFLPLLVLPGRLNSAYWYIPLIGVAIAVAALADRRYCILVSILLVASIPWDYLQLHDYRRQKLAEDAERSNYVAQLQAAAPSLQGIHTFFYQGLPRSFATWGLGGALRLLMSGATLYSLQDPDAKALLEEPALAALTWDQATNKLSAVVRRLGTPDAAYIVMNEAVPVWQLTEGWYGYEPHLRWMQPCAAARLYHPAPYRMFEVVFDVSQAQVAAGHRECAVRLNGEPAGVAHLTEHGIQVVRWRVPSDLSGTVAVDFHASPALRVRGDPRTLGAAIIGFGFVP